MAERRVIRPQEGFQMKFLSSSADIVIGGSAAGVGKTFSLLLDPLHYINTYKKFGGVIFRRTTPQIKAEGGLWDTSMDLYNHVNARPRESEREWVFNFGNKIKFAHLEYEKDKLSWQGSQIPFIGFDELTHFTEGQFFYLLTRNRSSCGVKPYVRATCNPDPDSWVATIISWWIDQETGYPIPERDGVIRYFIKNGQNYIWGDTIDEVKEKAWHFLEEMIKASGLVPENFIKSITFISGSVYDNKKLLEKDPNYISNLLSQDEDEQSRLLKGNWKHIPNDKDIYDYESFNAMFHSNVNCRTGKKRITADIALEGSNMFIVGVFDGRELIDIEIVEKSKGNEVIDKIKSLCRKHSIPNNQVFYDADGVGGFVDGFIQGAKPFHGGASPKEIKDSVSGKIIKENYMNLKTQCYYKSGSSVRNGEYSVSSEVANKSYMGKMTVMERMKTERRAIKKDKVDHDGKLRILPKQEMKVILNGDSPDILDMFMMNEFALMTPSFEWYVITE
jgi:hypothetical protein